MSNRAVFSWLIALFVARFATLACAADVFGFGEEFAKGAAAKAMLDGLGVPHHQLSYVYHEGGGFAVTHLKAFFFVLVGETVLAHKLAALTLTGALFVTLLKLAREHFPPRSDWFVAALFVLAPAPFVRFSLLNLGTHFEAVWFMALVLLFGLRCLAVERARTRDAIFLGLSAGFGLYFSLQLAPLLLVTALAFVWRRRMRVFGPETAWALAAFVVGALPLWIMLKLVGRAVLSVRGKDGLAGGVGFVESFESLFGPLWLARDPWVWAHALVFVVAIVFLLTRRRTRTEALLFGYLALFALAYASSGLALRYLPDHPGSWFPLIRFSSVWVFASLLASAGAALLWQRTDRARWLALLVVGVPLVSGARDLIALCRDGNPHEPLANLARIAVQRGVNYTEYFDKVQEHFPPGERARIEILLRFDEDPRVLAPAVSRSVFERSRLTRDEAVDLVRATFGSNWREGLIGLGRYLHTDWKYDVPRALAFVETRPQDERVPLVIGMGRVGVGSVLLPDRIDWLLAIQVPPPHEDPWLHGAGYRVQQTYRFRPDWAEIYIARQRPEFHERLRAGHAEAVELDRVR